MESRRETKEIFWMMVMFQEEDSNRTGDMNESDHRKVSVLQGSLK